MTAGAGGNVQFGAAAVAVPGRRTGERLRALAGVLAGSAPACVRTGIVAALPSRV